MVNRVIEPGGALYNLTTDQDEKSKEYLNPEFHGTIDDLFNLTKD
jgi:hypothetical protein